MDTVKECSINWQPLVMRLPTFELNADTFFAIAQANQDLHMERLRGLTSGSPQSGSQLWRS